jgi:hypothetical protein
MTQVDEEQRQEAPVSTHKLKESTEVMNLECSINYEAMGFGWGKASWPLLLGCLGFLLFLGFFLFVSLCCLCVLLYTSCMLSGAFTFLYNFSAYLS